VFKTLYAKLVAVLVCFAIVMAIMFLVVMRHLEMVRSQELHQKLYRTLAGELVREQILPEADGLDSLGIQKIFGRLRIINPRIDVYLLDEKGNIVASSGKTAVKRGAVDLQPIQRFLAENAALPIVGDDPTEDSRQRVFSVAPIALKGHLNGYLYLVMRGLTSDSIADRIKSSYVLRESIWMIVWGLVFALLASTLIIKLMTRPLRRLTTVMDKFRQSGFATQPDHPVLPARSSSAEVNQLTDTFNEMADRMLEQMQVLKQTDAKRRELVANISHDLRTPLATLQGYLETLQVKGDRLSAEEKRSYLETALKQSGQLSQLVSELFELAKLDSDQVKILREPFMLEDLVQDVVQQFELAASNRQVALVADLPVELPLVIADIGLIERALRNLIENSLRYTPAGGEVKVSLIPGEQHVTINVSDTGCGINAEDLPRIFDRFYRAEKSRSDSSGNAGLGLAITKRILELHGSSVSVASKPGMTTIGFTLAYSDTAAPLPSVPSRRPAPSAPASGVVATRAVPRALG
jgi:two-component system OmpR family sensor kinase